MSARRILIELQPTDRTDLLCIACGGFINVGGLLKRRGFAIETAAHEEHQAGIHAACMPHVRAKRAPAKKKGGGDWRRMRGLHVVDDGGTAEAEAYGEALHHVGPVADEGEVQR